MLWTKPHLPRRRPAQSRSDDVAAAAAATSTGPQDALQRQLALARSRLKSQRLRLDAIIENLAHGISLYDKNGRLVLCNQQFRDIYRLSPELVRRGVSFRRILEARVAANTHVGEDPEAYVADRMGAVGEQRPLGGIHRLNSGQMISMTHQPMSDGGWVSTHKDVTELFSMQAELTHLAYHDQLTGLPNRTLFYQRLGQAFDNLAANGGLAVLCLDLDGFKPINDTLGHAAGDALLREFASRLSSVLGPADTPARMGGDEFAVLHLGASEASADALAAAIVEAARAPYLINGEAVVVFVGIGIAHAPRDGGDMDLLLHSADLALYTAKRERRGGIRRFLPEMDRKLALRRRMEFDLRLAIERGEFELHYQPILDLATNSFSGFEALLRWRHPEEGLIGPSDFLPTAEDTGLILPIGEWVLREALSEASEWPDQLRIAVNLSALQLRRGNLLSAAVNALATTGVAPQRVEFEITESVFIEPFEDSLETLRRLRDLGARVVLDDFGAGNSPLSYLLAFPFDKIKLDGAFVRAIDAKAGAGAIVAAMAGLGAQLSMATTAEGIETAEQLRSVLRAGCTEAQGFLVSRPLPRDSLHRLLQPLRLRRADADYPLARAAG